MQVYLVQASYTTDEETLPFDSILVVYEDVSEADRTVEMLQRTFKPSSKAIKAEYTVLAFDVF